MWGFVLNTLNWVNNWWELGNLLDGNLRVLVYYSMNSNTGCGLIWGKNRRGVFFLPLTDYNKMVGGSGLSGVWAGLGFKV